MANIDKSKPITQQMFVDEEEEQKPKKSSPKKKQKSDEEIVLDEPSNILELPSKGLLGYPATVSYREIMVKDEEILSTATPDTYTTVLNKVLKSLLNNTDFYEKMSIHDRDFVLIWLWANNFDPIKEIVTKCESCGEKTTHKVDLRDIDVSDISSDFIPKFEIPLSNGKKCWVRMTTVEDELFSEDYVKRKNNKVSYDHVIAVRTIITEQVMTFEQKLDWVRENMKSSEMGIVRRYHSHFKFGVDPYRDYTCSACGEVTRDVIPFQAEDILMPSVQTDFDRLLSANKGVQDQSD